MKRPYYFPGNVGDLNFGLSRVIVLAILMIIQSNSSVWAITFDFQSKKAAVVCPTYGNLEYESATVSYEGQPLSITSVITGLVPNTIQTFNFTIDGVAQPPRTAPSDANGNIPDALHKLAILYSPRMLSLGTHTAVITSITIGDCVLPVTANNSVTVVVLRAPDLTPIVHTAPTILYGNAPFTFVVDVFELNNSPTTSSSTRTVKVYINKQVKINLSFDGNATSVGAYTVQNNAWSFDDSSDENYYILTTNTIIAAGDKLSVGLTGTLTPGSTSGSLALGAAIFPQSGGEVNIINNVDGDKITFFAK